MGIQREARLHVINGWNVIPTDILLRACKVQDIHGFAGKLVGRLKASSATTRKRQIKPVSKRLSYTYESGNSPTQVLPAVNQPRVPHYPTFVKIPKVALFCLKFAHPV